MQRGQARVLEEIGHVGQRLLANHADDASSMQAI